MAKRKKIVKKLGEGLPGVVYIKMEDGGDGEFYPASSTTLDIFDDGDEVGVYNMVDVGKVTVTRSLL